MNEKDISFNCPVPAISEEKILLAHGSGGMLSNKLITDIFLKEFNNQYLNEFHDGSVYTIGKNKIAFTTDSFVVDPLFFPGGNIGELAVYGTVNDLLMCGAKPLFISAAFIIEEGFHMNILKAVVSSMKSAAERCGILIITGDTKVVPAGKADKLFINTSGIGLVSSKIFISPSKAEPGDKIILSGTIADHGIAVLSAREDLGFLTEIRSDTAPLHELIEIVLNQSDNIHVLRDPTRGGVAGVLNEISAASGVSILIDEKKIKMKDEVRSACELLGFDPLYIANEGKCLIILPEKESEKVLNNLRAHPLGKDAEIIGEVSGYSTGEVILKTILGTRRKLDILFGDQLPRIC
jgi:hydrogenase expression/formation protein HypE